MTRSSTPPADQRTGGWPQFDPLVMREHGGGWVAVVVAGRVVLGGGKTPADAMKVGRQTARDRQLDPADVTVFAVCKPEDAWF